jgi:recombination protein RecR
MREFAPPVEALIEELKKLPGIGAKSAQRLAFHLIKISPPEAQRLAQAILLVKETIRTCSTCHNLTDIDPCRYCNDSTRDRTLICVVEESHNVPVIEKTREYQGLYHVLEGVLSPLHGVGPEQLQIRTLLERLRSGEVKEIIVATNPNVEGEATALYLSKLIKPLGVKVSRIATGVPVGSDLDYADQVTMSRAMEGRRAL